MAKKKPAKQLPGAYRKVVARNKRARHDYFLGESWEAGLILLGSEVKSLRGGRASIGEAYARMRGDELWLINANIPEYAHANRFNHDPTRDRKLLLRRAELNKLAQRTKKSAGTIVPLELFFNERGKVKITIALGTGKRQHDKRQTLKRADAQREMDRVRKSH